MASAQRGVSRLNRARGRGGPGSQPAGVAQAAARSGLGCPRLPADTVVLGRQHAGNLPRRQRMPFAVVHTALCQRRTDALQRQTLATQLTRRLHQLRIGLSITDLRRTVRRASRQPRAADPDAAIDEDPCTSIGKAEADVAQRSWMSAVA